jgi:predicted N-formylglutamate amidohydrolase
MQEKRNHPINDIGEKERVRQEGRARPSSGIARGSPTSPLLILCDHATNHIPPEYGLLGLSDGALERHIAYDIGALPVALELGRQLDATVIYSQFSRLLIDPNRGLDDPTLIMRLSDGAVIPGNVQLDDREISRRIERFYLPYDDTVATELRSMKARGLVPSVISIHSFTERWRGKEREWRAGILWDKDHRLALPLLEELRARTGFEIGDNKPYSGRLRGDMLYRHATLAGLPNALVEIRQDLIRERAGQLAWTGLLASCIRSLFAKEPIAAALSRVDYFGSHTDIRADGTVHEV